MNGNFTRLLQMLTDSQNCETNSNKAYSSHLSLILRRSILPHKMIITCPVSSASLTPDKPSTLPPHSHTCMSIGLYCASVADILYMHKHSISLRKLWIYCTYVNMYIHTGDDNASRLLASPFGSAIMYKPIDVINKYSR